MILIFAFLTAMKINIKVPKGGNGVLRTCFSDFFQRKKKIRVSNDYEVIQDPMIIYSLSQMTLSDHNFWEALVGHWVKRTMTFQTTPGYS